MYTIPKGVFDILPEDPDPKGLWRTSSRWEFILKHIKAIAKEYGLKSIQTPMFEYTKLFSRSVGENTDIVSKEMYTFEDKAKRELSLRPEGTAPVMRAFIEKKLYNLSSIHKFYYTGPMFRYERQQAGRYRQHHQFGVEVIGVSTPEQDCELIDLSCSFLDRLGLKNLTILINSVGNKNCRNNFRKALREYLTPYFSDLSEDSQKRFEKNPLRILDSKHEKDQLILEKAPSILSYLDLDAKRHFDRVCDLLTAMKLSFEINDKLVRGLDYYNRTVFEVVTEDLGAQNTLVGGGRYDSLIESLGGPSIPAVGFAMGIERILQTMEAQEVLFPDVLGPIVYLIPVGDRAVKEGFLLLKKLRIEGISAEMDFSGKRLKNAMKYADKIKSQYTLVLGENELETGSVELKNMHVRSVKKVPLIEITSTLKQILQIN